MAHWEHRPEAKWKDFRFNQPYAKGLRRLKQGVLGKTDFDPATLWRWGTMQAMALIEVLKDCEQTFGEKGQALVYRALRRVGQDVGRQILDGVFDCRVQRYFVQGMIDAAQEHAGRFGFQVRFDSTIPAGAPTCHFTMWKPSADEQARWDEYTRLLEAKALVRAKERR